MAIIHQSQPQTSPPPCRRLGPDCQSLAVTLRVGSPEEDEFSVDHEATWLLGHTEAISFGRLRLEGPDLLVDAVLHVPCRFLEANGAGVRCRAHGFRGPPPRDRPRPRQPRQLGGDRFRVVHGLEEADQPLRGPRRPLPVVGQPNPCLGARCRTADNTLHAACCRDLQIEILCGPGARRLESLVRARKSPYLCKVEREGPASLGAEVISACGYLGEDGISCALHGRRRPDGRPAKPDLCSDWPDDGKGEHPGCWYPGSPKGY